MKPLVCALIFLIIYCEFSDENVQGPPETTETEGNKKTTEDDDEDTKEYIASIEDRDGTTAIRIEPAPDFTNERENVKGMLFIYKNQILSIYCLQNDIILLIIII